MLQKKIILLTGGADGIGWKCAQAYVKAGAVVCILDRKSLEPSQVNELPPNNFLFIESDISNEQSVKEAMAILLNKFGRLDGIHNNAGTGNPAKPLHTTSNEEWDTLMNVNLKSIFLTTKYGIEHLKKTKGAVLNTSSMVGSMGQDNHAAYVATKGAVNALTKAMALDYAAWGIRVNAIAPAAVKTPMLETWISQQPDPGKMMQYLNALQPLGNMPEGDVIADAAVFLLSDAARFITGCILPVSGGAELGYKNSI